MNKNVGIITIIALIIVVVGVVGAVSFNNHQNTKPISAKSTKLALYNNNPNAWLHMDLVVQGVTFKNGKKHNLYIEAFMQPATQSPNGKTLVPGSVTIDLSQLLGYGNHKLPAGTYRILSWKGLYNPTAGGTSNLLLSMQGWSNTRFPSANDQLVPHKINIPYSGTLPIGKLNPIITQSTYFVSTNPANLKNVDNDANELLFEEEMLTVDPNGHVSITVTVPPTLCKVMARRHIV